MRLSRWNASAVRSPTFSTENPSRSDADKSTRRGLRVRLPHRAFDRCVAFASGRSENVTHQAMRVHANQHGLVARVDVSSHQSDVRLTALDPLS